MSLKTSSFRLYSLMLLACSCGAALSGQTTGQSADDGVPLALPDFEIRADRVPATDNSELEERRLVSPEQFTGVTREEFGRRANRRAGDIVARLPGVFMGGPPGENKDARLRGLDKEFARTQVDGLTLPDGGEKRELQLNRVPADLIQEVRVLRNPSPEFESDGLAGRLDFRFRRIPEGRLTGELRLGAGERNRAADTRWLGSIVLAGRLNERLGGMASFFYLDDPTYKFTTEQEFAATGTVRKSTVENEAKPTTSRDFFADVVWNYADGEIHLKPLRLFTVSARYVGERPGDDASTDVKTQAAEYPVDAAVHVRLGRGLSLFVEGNNVTDARKHETTLKADGSRIVKEELTGRAWFARLRYHL
jgi:outer membrane receptor protein involved in Fe transport